MAGERESLEFCLLGSLEARRDGLPVPLGGAKQKALLARLLIDAPAVVSVDTLVDDLWGEQPPDTALHTVQVFVSRLRKALGASALLTQAPGYLVDAPGEKVDAGRFRALAAQAESELAGGRPQEAAERFEQAFALWRGQPFAEFAYEAWAREPAERLEELRLSALEGWTEARLALGRHGELVGELEQLVVEHPLRERFRAQLMLALYRGGRQAAALDVYTATRELLAEELGVDPSPELKELYRQILNQDERLAAPARAAVAVRPRSNVPHPSSRLIGRTEELDLVEQLLAREDVRCVTLTGAGGTGKTRLALEVANRVAALYPDGVWWVPLQAIRDPTLVESEIAQAVGVEGDFAEEIGDNRPLLVIDNFEQVASAAPKLAELLASTGVTLLITSREPTHVAGEHRYPVEPLPNDAAAELFAERAQAADPEFRETPAVLEICERLDGLPLAIELAAARTNLFDADSLLSRLDHRLPLLESRSNAAPERQRTLRATIEWSYDLLDADEKNVLARLAVFVGGFDVESAAQVCDASVDTLSSLVERSLVRRVAAGRFGMLETIGEYAGELFEGLADSDRIRRAHAQYFAHLLEMAEPELRVGDQRAWLERLEREQPNVRQALDWTIEAGETECHLALLGYGWRFWYLKGDFVEGRARLDRGVALAEAAESLDTGGRLALAGAAAFALLQGDMPAARSRAQATLAATAAEPDPLAAVLALWALSMAADSDGDSSAGGTYLEEAYRLARRAEDEWSVAWSAANLAGHALQTGNFPRALEWCDEALPILQEFDRQLVAQLQLTRAYALLGLEQLSEAETLLRMSLTIAREIGNSEAILFGLIGLAVVETRRERIEEAAALLGAVDGLLTEMRYVLRHPEDGLHNEALEVVRSRLAPDELEAAWAGFRAMSREELLEFAETRSSAQTNG